jgi:hypothetical protein
MDDLISDAEQACRDCDIIGRAHYIEAGNAAAWNRRLGIAATVAAAVVGISIIASVESHPDLGWKITAGVVALAGAVLSAIQTSLKLNERVASHQIAGAKYRGLGRDFELFKRTFASPDGVVWNDQTLPALDSFRVLSERRAQLALEHPGLHDRVWAAAQREAEEADLTLPRLASRRAGGVARWSIENAFRLVAVAAVIVVVVLAVRSLDAAELYKYVSFAEQR